MKAVLRCPSSTRCHAAECSPSSVLTLIITSVLSLQDEISNESIEEILMGLASQITEREDSILCSDVRNNLFGPMEFSRRDLAALNIMRGRDNGLADYNTVRKCFGFPMLSNFSEINPQQFENNQDTFKM